MWNIENPIYCYWCWKITYVELWKQTYECENCWNEILILQDITNRNNI